MSAWKQVKRLRKHKVSQYECRQQQEIYHYKNTIVFKCNDTKTYATRSSCLIKLQLK